MNNSGLNQKGAATLFVVVVLLIVMAVIALMVGQKGLMEQQMTGNDLRAKEAQEAAEAGLERGVAFAASNVVPPSGTTSIECSGPGSSQTGCPNLTNVSSDQTTSGETYNISSLYFERVGTEFIRITSRATGGADGGDQNISARSTVYIKPGGILSSNATLPPPLVMSGCMTQTTGTPDIVPGSNGTAIMTSQPDATTGGEMCLNHCGPGGGNNNPCQNPDADGSFAHLDINGGTLENDQAYPDWDGDGEGTVWEYYFDVPVETYQQYASDTLSTEGGMYYITDSGNQPNGTYGSLSNPAIMVFENGCPKFNGNTTIYGIVFFRDQNACVSNGMNGWGNVTIYGSIGVTGGVHQLNANIEIYGVGSGSGLEEINQIPINASKLPGTWNDFI